MTGYSLKEISTRLNTGQIPQVAAGKPVYTQEELVGAIGNINSPLLDMPLKNSLAMKAGVGSATFTRASIATYIDIYGVLKTAAIDEPRFEKEGYLNEGASTNLLAYSNQFNSGGGWTISNATATQNTIGPDGVVNSAWYLDETTAVGTSYVYKPNFALTAGTTYAASLFAKKAEDTEVYFWFANTFFNSGIMRHVKYNFDTGVLSDVNNNLISKSVEILSDGWVRISATFTVEISASASAMVIGSYPETNTTGSGVYIFGAQLEALPFATSYIPTTSATVTRAADVLNVTRANNMPNAQSNANGFSVAFDMNSIGQNSTTSQYAWSLYTTGTDFIGSSVFGVSAIRQSLVNNSGSIINAAVTTNFKKRRVISTASNSILRLYIDGALGDVDINTTGRLTDTANTLTNIRIGGLGTGTSSNFNGHISNLRIYDKELTAQEVALA